MHDSGWKQFLLLLLMLVGVVGAVELAYSEFHTAGIFCLILFWLSFVRLLDGPNASLF